MGSNRFGTLFTITTWGESHGKAIGVVVDGCPAGLPITEEEIALALMRRRPGFSPYTSERAEADMPELLSGVFQGVTTGAPISILIRNRDVQSAHYEQNAGLLRPGHANFTYQTKYGVFDPRGGGRASARETACRVAAGAIGKKLLAHYEIEVAAYLEQIGELTAEMKELSIASFRPHLEKSNLFWPSPESEERAATALTQVREEGDSLGGIVSFLVENLPAGLGDPIYEKLEAKLASALMSLPASKGFSIGSGFDAPFYRGSSHNDLFSKIGTLTNHAGGMLGGISTGMPLYGKVAFKPTSSIGKAQSTVDWEGNPQELPPFPGKRHDPCVAIRAVPVVEAMVALVLADALLLQRSSRL